jgi:predicted metal-dependent phosphoesterase TrpH
MPGDLHTHTTFSDGSVPVERLPLMAARAGLDAIAISDHDSEHSVQYAYAHPAQDGVRLIPATELTAYDFERGHRVHLLCYWPDDCAALRAHCDTMRRRRNECCLQSARELEAMYPQFRTEQALEYARDSGVLFKSGIMQALCELGLAKGIYGKEYARLFGAHAEGEGLVLHQPEYLPVAEVLATIRAARGVVVFAHPTVYKSMPLVRQLAAEGKIDGIEIDHPRNSEEDKAECRALCAQYDLIATGGTDFHGSNAKHPLPVGTCRTSDAQIERIDALARRRKNEA